MRPSVRLSRSSMLLLSEQHVKKCLSMKDCLEVNRKALISVANGDAQVPSRLGLQYIPSSPTLSTSSSEAAAADWTLFKPAAYMKHHTDLSPPHTSNMGMKLVSIRANNPSQGLPLVPATILSVDADTGCVQAVVAGTYLTAARTAAGSVLSAMLIKGQTGIHRVTIFGAGLQARLHIQLLATALERPIPHVTILNRTMENAQRLQSEIPSEWATHVQVVPLSDALAIVETLAETDVIFCATNTTAPILGHSPPGIMLRPDTHIAGVGSYTPDMQEVAARVVDQCRVLVDTPEARAVGDLKHLTEEHPVTLVGTALANPQAPDPVGAWFPTSQGDRARMLDCTFFKSVGTAIQDVLTADLVVQKAKELGIGTEVDMS